MSGLFSPSMPSVPEPVKPPTTDDARQAEEDVAKLRRRRGRASTFLTAQGRTSRAASMLLGAGTSDTSTAGAAASSGASGGSTGTAMRAPA